MCTINSINIAITNLNNSPQFPNCFTTC